MAKRRKKSANVKNTIKYELYGIVILILSVIALLWEGSFAHALTYLFRFLIGTLDWVIPCVFIYIALFVMINRAWPRKWTARKTSLFLILIGMVVLQHMTMIRELDPNLDSVTPSYIVSETWHSMVNGMFPVTESQGILKHGVGGGMCGAVLYAGLYFLFGNLGTRLIIYTLFVIGFILFTGISLVELGLKGKGSYESWKKGFKNRLVELFAGKKGRKTASLANKVKSQVYIPDEEDEDEEEFVPPAGKKPTFFQNLQPSKKKRVIIDALEAEGTHVPSISEPEAALPPAIQIRNFQDHIDPPTAEPVKAQAPKAMDEMPIEDFDLAKEKKPGKPYHLPGFSILAKPAGAGKGGGMEDFKANARKLESTLESFGVRAKVLEVVRGPSVTRYEIQPDVGVKVSRIVSLTDDIALALAAKDIRMEAPIPGKAAIGIEVPNTEVSIVTLREVMESSAFQNSTSKLSVTLGRDIGGQPIVGNLAKFPHVLVAGATGSGKSVCINGIITSILYKAKPDEVKFLMIDPKMVELNVYNGIPHLLAPVVTDPRRASLALKKIVVEMEKRYELFSKSGTRNLEGYNAMITDPGNPQPGEPLPFIVVIVDELADLMMVAANDVEDSITRLAQMARAAGIHLIIATQRPSVDVITGVIKANIPSRIAFGVSSQVDSRTILDMVGAEKLLGRGDMLYLPVGASKPVRVQGAFLSDQEVEAVVSYVSNQAKAEYQEDLVPEVEEQPEAENGFDDELYDQAVQIVVEAKQASVSLLQRRMRVGYTRAARLIDTMELRGVVGPYEGSKPREVLMTLEQFQHNRMSS